MARTSIKSTYSLDVGTIRKLERVAARWRVSKSEVLRRAIDAVDRDETAGTLAPLDALLKLQSSVKLTPPQANRWFREVRRERSEASARREWRKQ